MAEVGHDRTDLLVSVAFFGAFFVYAIGVNETLNDGMNMTDIGGDALRSKLKDVRV